MATISVSDSSLFINRQIETQERIEIYLEQLDALMTTTLIVENVYELSKYKLYNYFSIVNHLIGKIKRHNHLSLCQLSKEKSNIVGSNLSYSFKLSQTHLSALCAFINSMDALLDNQNTHEGQQIAKENPDYTVWQSIWRWIFIDKNLCAFEDLSHFQTSATFEISHDEVMRLSLCLQVLKHIIPILYDKSPNFLLENETYHQGQKAAKTIQSLIEELHVHR